MNVRQNLVLPEVLAQRFISGGARIVRPSQIGQLSVEFFLGPNLRFYSPNILQDQSSEGLKSLHSKVPLNTRVECHPDPPLPDSGSRLSDW